MVDPKQVLTNTTKPHIDSSAIPNAGADSRQATPPNAPGSPYTTTHTSTPFTSTRRRDSDNMKRDQSPKTGAGERPKEQRLIVVSNRLPVTISKDDKGEYHFKVG